MTRKFTTEEKAAAVQQFCELRDAGKTLEEIEKQLGIGNGTLYKWTAQAKQESKEIKRATMMPDPPPPAPLTLKAPRKDASGRYPEEIRQKALLLLASGKRPAHVAKELKITPQAVHYWRNTSKGTGTLLPTVTTSTATGIGAGGELQDALIYLRHAEREIMEMVRDGKIARPDQAHLLTLLALGAIQKSINKQ